VRLLARQRLNLGVALFTVGRLAEATARLQDAIVGAEAVEDLDTLAEALRMAVWVYQTRGMFAESRAAQQRGLDVAQRLGDVVGLRHILFLDALWAFYVGEWDHARVIAERSLAVFGTLDLTHLSAYPPLGLGWLSTIEGDRDAGERYLAQAEKFAEQNGPPQVLRFITALRAECELLAGQAEAANRRLTPWFSGEPMQERTRLELSVLRAWTAVELGAGAEAETLVVDTVQSARAADMRLVLPDALRVQALWAMRRRRWREAEVALEEAVTLCRAMPYPYAEAKALYVFGQLRMAQGAPARARVRFEGALTICHQLGERLYGAAIELAQRP
jgi:tetratricopeptide (TPR) repeat protein